QVQAARAPGSVRRLPGFHLRQGIEEVARRDAGQEMSKNLTLIVALLAVASACFAAPPGRVVRVGLLYPISPDFDPAKNPFARELVEGLRELGYRPGRDIVFELRSAAAPGTRLPQLAAELISAKVEMIVAPGTQAVLDA